LFKPSLLEQGDAEVGVDSRVVGIDPDRRAQFGDRSLQLSLVEQSDAEVVVGLGVDRPLALPIPDPDSPEQERTNGPGRRS